MAEHPRFKQVVAQVFQNQSSMPRAIDSSVTGNDPYKPLLASASEDVFSLNCEDITSFIHKILLIYLYLDSSILLVKS